MVSVDCCWMCRQLRCDPFECWVVYVCIFPLVNPSPSRRKVSQPTNTELPKSKALENKTKEVGEASSAAYGTGYQRDIAGKETEKSPCRTGMHTILRSMDFVLGCGPDTPDETGVACEACSAPAVIESRHVASQVVDSHDIVLGLQPGSRTIVVTVTVRSGAGPAWWRYSHYISSLYSVGLAKFDVEDGKAH
jgi:hypothetical protein